MERENNKLLIKALNILDLFLVSKPEISLIEIYKELGLSKATASRLTSTLVKYGYLCQEEYRGKLSLGTKYFRFSGLIKSRIPLRKVATPFLIRLSQRINEAIFIAYVEGKENVFTETYQDVSLPPNKYILAPDENAGLLLHCTGIGKIMLAEMNDEELDRFFHDHNLEKLTPHTITDLKVLKKQLETVRQDDVALDFEEFRNGIIGITVGIRDIESKLIGGIGVTAPPIRLTEKRIQELIPEIKGSALEISRQMGFKE